MAPPPAADERPEQLYLRVLVNKTPVIGFVDTGSASSHISQACVRRCGLQAAVDNDARTELVGIAGIRVWSLGKIRGCSMHVPSSASIPTDCCLNVLPDDHSHCSIDDVLIGMDVLLPLNARVDLRRMVLRYDGSHSSQEVPFISEAEIRAELDARKEAAGIDASADTVEDGGTSNDHDSSGDSACYDDDSVAGDNFDDDNDTMDYDNGVTDYGDDEVADNDTDAAAGYETYAVAEYGNDYSADEADAYSNAEASADYSNDGTAAAHDTDAHSDYDADYNTDAHVHYDIEAIVDYGSEMAANYDSDAVTDYDTGAAEDYDINAHPDYATSAMDYDDGDTVASYGDGFTDEEYCNEEAAGYDDYN